MRRRFGICLGVGLLGLVFCPAAFADASAWPAFPIPDDLKQFPRGPGFYFSIWKLLAIALVYLIWVRTTDWVNRDTQLLRFNHALWNAIFVASFPAALMLTFLSPWFALNLPLLLLATVVPLATYVAIRNPKVEPHEQVFTPDHLRYVFATAINRFGGNMEVESLSPSERGPDLQFKALGGATEQANLTNLHNARQTPGHQTARELVFDAVLRRAAGIRLEYTATAVAVFYQIDGVWHGVGNQERAQADPLLAVLKILANLNPNDRRSRQTGHLEAVISGKKHMCRITTQGTQTGEVAVLQVLGKKQAFDSIEAAGMRPKMAEDMMQLLERKTGAFLICSPVGGGFSTTFNAVLQSLDRFTRNFVIVEELSHHEEDIENVTITTFDETEGENAMSVLPKLMRTYPDVVVMREPPDGLTYDFLLDQTNDNRYTIFGVRAKEAVEAPVRVLMQKGDAQLLSSALVGVLNTRLIRKLCENCREAYPVTPEILQQLGLPPGKIEVLYRPPAPPVEGDRTPVCKVCNGIGYFDRTAIFELLAITDEMREILQKFEGAQPAQIVQTLRKLQRASRQRGLQEEGLLLVAKGLTSVQELIRTLKS